MCLNSHRNYWQVAECLYDGLDFRFTLCAATEINMAKTNKPLEALRILIEK